MQARTQTGRAETPAEPGRQPAEARAEQPAGEEQMTAKLNPGETPEGAIKEELVKGLDTSARRLAHRRPKRRAGLRLRPRRETRPAKARHGERLPRQRKAACDFAFATETPAALFRRADTVWLLFDTAKPIDIEPIRNNGGSLIAEVKQVPLDNGQAIRIRLNRPQMPSLTGDDRPATANWT